MIEYHILFLKISENMKRKKASIKLNSEGSELSSEEITQLMITDSPLLDML